jgi:hypothetical protein
MKQTIKSTLIFLSVVLIISSCKDNNDKLANGDPDKSSVQSYVPIELEEEDSNIPDDENNLVKTTSEDDCSALLKPVYNTFKVTTDKELIIKLQEIYSLDETRYKQATKGTSGGGGGGYFPFFGSAEYDQNKKSIDKLHRKISKQSSGELSLDEYKELTVSTVSPDVAIAMYDAYSSCRNSRNRLRLVYNDDTKVVFELYLRPIPYARTTKFISAIGGNLSLDESSSIKEGRKVKYGSGYTLVFNRKDKRAGSVTINIDNEEPLTKKFDSPLTKTIVSGWCSADDNDKPYIAYAKVTLDYKGKKYTVTNVDGTTTTKAWNRKMPVNAVIKTNYNSDVIRISDVSSSYNKYIRAVSHSLRTYPSSTNVDIATIISPTKTKATVTFTIHYQKLCSRCVANCD